MSNFQRQLMLKNLKGIPKLALEEQAINIAIGELSISELKQVRGFGENTIIKLRDNGITTVQKLAKIVSEGDNLEIQKILTPVQNKQFKTYLSENPLLVEDTI